LCTRHQGGFTQLARWASPVGLRPLGLKETFGQWEEMLPQLAAIDKTILSQSISQSIYPTLRVRLNEPSPAFAKSALYEPTLDCCHKGI